MAHLPAADNRHPCEGHLCPSPAILLLIANASFFDKDAPPHRLTESVGTIVDGRSSVDFATAR